MTMLRKLLADRFQLTFHREEKEFSIYALSVAKGGPKLKESTLDPDETPDGSQFGGLGLKGTPESTKPGLFAALQEQLGLRLEATKGPIATVVIDKVERPSDNQGS